MKNKARLFPFFFLFPIIFISCTLQQPKLKGFWENDQKILEFGDDYFQIYNKNNQNVIAFRGLLSYAKTPSYAIKLSYKEYMDSEGNWQSLDGTDFEDYVDTLLFNVEKDNLETKVLGNGQCYLYHRATNPLETSKN